MSPKVGVKRRMNNKKSSEFSTPAEGKNEMGMGGNRNLMESKGKIEIHSKRTHYTTSLPLSKREINQQHLARRDEALQDTCRATVSGWQGGLFLSVNSPGRY
jgi:hypothetical protein